MEILSFNLGNFRMIMAEFKSKKGIVSMPPFQLYMSFVDMRNLVQMIPEDKREGVTADYDSIHATVQGFGIGVKVIERVPYSLIGFEDDGSPFKFSLAMHFDSLADQYKTEFSIEVEAELNFMMKAVLGSKIKSALDQVVDAMVAISEGRLPEGVDPSIFPDGFDPSKFGMNRGS